MACNLLKNLCQGLIKWKRGYIMKIKKYLANNYRILGLGGILGSWFTISAIWVGGVTLPLIGFAITGGLFGLALIGTAQ